MRRALLSSFVLCLAALCSCGGSFSKPEEAVGTFLSRLSTGDVAGARACVATDEQPMAQLTPATSPVEYDIGRATFDGQHAMVPVVVMEGDQRTDSVWVAVKEGGGWRVSVMMTITRSMFEGVDQEIKGLDPDATDEEKIEALRRGMQRAAPGR